ncbi:MAG: diguanylate cyclase domain-containing protein [Bacillota bacterium]
MTHLMDGYKRNERIIIDANPNDVLFRFGGEEFLMFLPVTEAEHAYEVAKRIR